jgi:hypothetical protein
MMLNEFDLREDPFPIVPDGPVHNWAGRTELKEDLIDLVKGVRARDIGVTEFVVLYGEYGAGKSHALRFLRTLISEATQKPDGEFRSLAIYLERPRVATKLNFLELQRYIIRLIGRDQLIEFAAEVAARVSKRANALAAAANMSAATNLASFHTASLDEIKPNDRAMVRLLDNAKDDIAGAYSFLIGEGLAPNKEYEGKVDSDFMAAKVLADLFRVLTSDISGEPPVQESIYLFVDESEALLEAKASESELVFAGLRELINGIPYRFCLILSFSAATALIEAIMPQHMLKRMTRQYFEVPMLSDDEAVEFTRAQIDFFRVPESSYAGSFYPFTEEAVRYIVENQNSITPRNLFMSCKRVLERAIRRQGLTAGDEITVDMATSILSGIH